MAKLLQITTKGMKNLSEDVTLDFSNRTVRGGIKKVNNVKGIFGYNGSGKTALISSVDLYKKVVTDQNYLLQNETIKTLAKMINYSLESFYFSMVLGFDGGVVLRHRIKVEKSPLKTSFVISFEELSFLVGRTLNSEFKVIFKKENGSIQSLDNELSFLNPAELDYSSLLYRSVLKPALEGRKESKYFSSLEHYSYSFLSTLMDIRIFTLDSDDHRNAILDKKSVSDLINAAKYLETFIGNWQELYSTDTIVPIKSIRKYEKENKNLQDFIKLFKPSLLEIKLNKAIDGKAYHVRKVFVYKDYSIDYEYESSGIKHLVALFTYLQKCASGGIVFIDEMDVNINSIYFSKLISFFKIYCKGQLIFTTHNVEAMNVLKGQARSIAVLGADNELDTWVGSGNRSPIKDYFEGNFPNSPMNIEDFDFLKVFLGGE